MLRSAALLGVMLRSQVLAAGFGRPAGSLRAATPLARAASRLAGHPGRPSGSETLPQRHQQRSMHRGCTAMAQRYDRSRRYDVVPPPDTKPAASRPSAPPTPAPSPPAAPRAPADAPPMQRRAPQPSAPPAAQQQQQQLPAAAGREEPSVDYGVLMRPDSRRCVGWSTAGRLGKRRCTLPSASLHWSNPRPAPACQVHPCLARHAAGWCWWTRCPCCTRPTLPSRPTRGCAPLRAPTPPWSMFSSTCCSTCSAWRRRPPTLRWCSTPRARPSGMGVWVFLVMGGVGGGVGRGRVGGHV